ncbi:MULTISPECIES: cystathionine beta-lyase [unclassified Sphingopyxis]|uniref:cystathionine beta-lyase n=1 Tax=unclassified Sphingopyxis TaxID=2614943 RepID=UPI00073125D8|nr:MULTISPECIES: cystathionine beta-lyase [unclassified Sphingopyxis]KTE25955.1 cystathionine beta-lyase [Sphingopyxis sp. H057]KTE48915.1 cystathionine beta-lyase [Sphingopyxis sp. H071]KTE51635.1 cystathionine beta-lyase [Sphingopyxis sp. H073]KTE52417.1 cystathionine beta-lyase [Sphingopyxis sp. H107]KTE65351.1 cystathionine beta-lyase [Sphingopyxis sp. H081]
MSKRDDDSLRPATKLVQGGRRPEWTGDPRLGGSIVNPPVWRASTILYDNIADLKARGHATHDKLYYGRRGTPTVWALADALTALEPGAEGTLLYPSGVAANSAGLLALLSPGDHLLMVDSAYEPTRAFCNGMLARMGVRTSFYDPLVGAGIAELIEPETKLIFLESPGSLTFEVQDIPAITKVARARGVLTMLDNTWATPLLFPALAHGVDVAMMSLTKYAGGHSDAMMGSLTATKAVWPKLRQAAYQLGQAVSPDDCALILRGLRTLDVRLARHGENGLAVANWLAGRAEVGRVLHPALRGDRGHELWTRDFKGTSGLFGFTLKGADEAARTRFIDALDHFGIGFSWGGYESLVVPSNPADIRTATVWSDPDPLVRLSVGLEDPADLIADLARGLAAL